MNRRNKKAKNGGDVVVDSRQMKEDNLIAEPSFSRMLQGLPRVLSPDDLSIGKIKVENNSFITTKDMETRSSYIHDP